MHIGYIFYLICIWIGTGILILCIDYLQYKKANMTKEMKWSKYLGICNICIGLAAMVGRWAYYRWFWT